MTSTLNTGQLLVDDATWWRQAVVYQIYPRSFADANGDGIGDLPRHHLPRAVPGGARRRRGLAQPVLPVGAGRRRLRRRRLPRRRPAARHARRLRRAGRGAARRRHPGRRRHRAEPHLRPARVVPRGARRRARGSAARDRYIFRDGLGPDGARAAVRLGRALRRAGLGAASRDGQWYLHLFAREQPDLNWDNREVRDDFLHDAAVLGGPRRRRLPHRRRARARQGPRRAAARRRPSSTRSAARRRPPALGPRRGARDLRRVARGVRRVRPAAHRGRRGLGATPSPRPALRQRRGPRPGVQLRPAPGRLRRRAVPHDHHRQPRRCRGSPGRRRRGCSRTTTSSGTPRATGCPRRTTTDARDKHGADVAAARAARDPALDVEPRACAAPAPRRLFMLGLPGSAYLYQGEELGLHEGRRPPRRAERQDPTFFRNPGVDMGRDGCRVPLPWTRDGLVVRLRRRAARTCRSPRGSARLAVEAAGRRPRLDARRSTARALALRRELQTDETLDWLPTPDPTSCASPRPNGWQVVTNFGTDAVPLPDGEVLRHERARSTGPAARRDDGVGALGLSHADPQGDPHGAPPRDPHGAQGQQHRVDRRDQPVGDQQPDQRHRVAVPRGDDGHPVVQGQRRQGPAGLRARGSAATRRPPARRR